MRIPTKAEIASRLRSVQSKESKGKTYVDLENEAELYSLEKHASVHEPTNQADADIVKPKSIGKR